MFIAAPSTVRLIPYVQGRLKVENMSGEEMKAELARLRNENYNDEAQVQAHRVGSHADHVLSQLAFECFYLALARDHLLERVCGPRRARQNPNRQQNNYTEEQ